MFEVRIHGRGGQGVVTAAELLSAAAFEEGRHAQAFPSFGSERTGAPVVAFCRVSETPIRVREPVMAPHALVVQDATLVHQVDLFAGLRPDGYVLVNSRRTLHELGLDELLAGRDGRVLTVPATDIAREHVGRPMPNAVLLGALAALTGLVHLPSVTGAIAARFPAKVADANIAAAVGACRPQVICAYPISPQTHIVETLSKLVKQGDIPGCEFMNVESEFAAMSVAIGASAAGARSYTATASQGLLFMVEAVYNASGLGLPIVMTVANRAIGAPINIWNDHSDAMSQRDSGWIQLYAESNQEATDLHVQAFRIAEELSLPVMVCMDGFILTHAVEEVDVPGVEQVQSWLPPYEPRQVLDPDDPVSIGAMVGPEAFTEVRYLAHARQMQALDLIPEVAADFERTFGRGSGGLVRPYRIDEDGHRAETVVVALGSVLGTIKDVVDERRAAGESFGVLGITSFRPFPMAAARQALEGVRRVVVLEKAFSVGIGGIVTSNLRDALAGLPVEISTVVAGLGGRPITTSSLHGLLDRVDTLPHLEFLDLDHEMVGRELARQRTGRRSGPAAENMLKDLGVVAARPH